MAESDRCRARWCKSTRSNGAGGNCVEVADLVTSVGVRDSKAPADGHLVFSADAWSVFADAVKGGRYDLS
ncbi:DUF397 domain-containing protein [Spirillospora sp. CA-253888]